VILTPKVRKTLDIATRLIIAALSISYIFYRIYSLPAGQVHVFADSVLASNEFAQLFAALILLLFCNIGFEAFKWKLLIQQSEKVSLFTAYKAILGGMAVSVFTPNRVGEFMGRVFILKKTEPLTAILLTIVGSFSQLLVTVVAGSIAYIIFAPQYLPLVIFESAWIVKGFSVTLALVSLLYVFLYFNISALHRVSFVVPSLYSQKIRNGINAIAACPRRLLFIAVLLSTLRYLVFSTQFYLAIRLAGLGFTISQCMLVVPIMYLLLVIIPTVALTEIGVRGSISVFLFGLLTATHELNPNDALAVISASTLIWFINVAFPSLLGVLVVFKLKFFRR
jgi:uncharacterized membrane protein YbhN (UPF0104 family)